MSFSLGTITTNLSFGEMTSYFEFSFCIISVLEFIHRELVNLLVKFFFYVQIIFLCPTEVFTMFRMRLTHKRVGCQFTLFVYYLGLQTPSHLF